MFDDSMEKIFYTIGYEGLEIKQFIQRLKDNGIKTLADSRYNAFSMNPDFRQKRLISHLEESGIAYVHLKEYGVPSEIRKAGNPIKWYIENVKPKIKPSLLDSLIQPVCFMCVEREIESCHRKVILETLM
jgi:uncharacterized protein (DUF488 family)